MTGPRTNAKSTQEKSTGPRKRPAERGLDAEILRDLEVDERAGEVRGGACPKSKPV